MKSIAQQISETQDALIASGKFTSEQLKESTKESISFEQKLSILKSLAKKNNIKESVEILESHRVSRNNGSSQVFTEAGNKDLKEEVERLKRSYGISTVEALLHFVTRESSGTEWMSDAELREGWQPYKDILSKDEVDMLVRRRVPVPVK